MAAAVVLFSSICAPAFAAVARAPNDLSGVWFAGTAPQPIWPLDGSAAPLNGAGLARYQETAAETRAIRTATAPNDVRKCLPPGVPRIWGQPYPFQIVQSSRVVGIVYEYVHVWRLIYMDEPQTADEIFAGFSGHSVGRWEGDTLVVDVALFNGKTVLDDSGLPHSTGLHVTERIRRIGNDELEVVSTIEDPQYYTRPWTVRTTFRRQPTASLQEYVCGFGAFETRYTRQQAGRQ